MQTTFTYTPIPAVFHGPRNINTLKSLINEVGQWARTNSLSELNGVMRDVYGLTVTCWTEVDEGLQQLSQAVRQIEHGETVDALDSIRRAMRYLHRWQDRGGAIGNAECVTEEELTGLMLEDGAIIPAAFATPFERGAEHA